MENFAIKGLLLETAKEKTNHSL